MSIESRLAALEQFAALQDALETARMKNETMREAEAMALRSIVSELAENVGVTLEDLDQHFALRRRWWHERLILRAGDRDPSLAERLSVQFPDESEPPPDGFPSIFDPPGTE